MIWRVVWKGFGTLRDIEEHWSFVDVIHANEIISAVAEAEEKARVAS